MVKHCCGSCCFFQDAGLAGSGWCHHPQRRTTSDLLIMVRRNELACRDEWAHSLWQPGVFGAVSTDPPGLALDRRVPPVTEFEIAALVKTEGIALDHQDVVLGEARLVSEPEFRPSLRIQLAEAAGSASRPPILDLDTRTAIKRARETYRERMRLLAKEAAEAEAPDAPPPAPTIGDNAPTALGASPDERAFEGERVDAGSGDDGGEELVEDSGGQDEAVPLEFGGRIGNGATDSVPAGAPSLAEVADLNRTSDDAGLVGLPRRTEPELGDRAAGRRNIGDGGDAVLGTANQDLPNVGEMRRLGVPQVGLSLEWDDAEESEVTLAAAPKPPQVTGRPPSMPASSTVRRIETPWTVATSRTEGGIAKTEGALASGGSGDPSSWSSFAVVEQGDDMEPLLTDDAEQAGWPIGSEPQVDSGSTDEPPWSSLEGSRFGEAEVSEGGAAADGLPREDQGSEEIAAVLPTSGWTLFATVAAGVPRLCRTCRSYRPGEAGERGWCANQWAFTHRRLVEPDEAQPCESTVGSWWLPADGVCLAAADISNHGQPTPHLDRWLPTHRERPTERKQS